MGKFNISADVSAAGRKSLANAIRRLRKPNTMNLSGKHGEYHLHSVMSEVVASTRLRNLNKVGSKSKGKK